MDNDQGTLIMREIVEVLKARLYDPRYVVLAIAFVIGFLSLFGSIQTNWPLLGPITEFIRNNILGNAGPLLKLAIGVLLGVILFEVLILAISGGQWQFGIKGIIATFLLVWFVIMFMINLPVLLGQGNPGNVYSVIPAVGNFIGGP